MPTGISSPFYSPIGRKKPRRDDDEMYVPPRPQAQQQPAEGFGAPARPRAGGLPDVVKDQIIEQNMIRRQGNFEREQVDQAQVRRRAAAIHQARKFTGVGGAIPLPAGRPAIPLVQPAQQQQADPNGLGAAIGTMERIRQQPTAFAGAPLSQFPATPDELARARSTSPGTPENDARLLASPDPTISGPMQDAQGINQRMALLAQNPGMDVGAIQRQQQVQAANAAMTRPPLAPLPALPQGRAGAGQTVPGEGTLETRLRLLAEQTSDPRLQVLIEQMERGQSALDSGSSLERQQFDARQAAQRRHEVDLARAQNPPRPAPGPATQPKSPPSATEVRIGALRDEMRRIEPTVWEGEGDAAKQVINPRFKEIQKEIESLLSQPAAQAQPAAGGIKATGKTPDGRVVLSDGRTVSKEEADKIPGVYD